MLTALQSAVIAQLGYDPANWDNVPEGGTSEAFDEIAQTLSDIATHGAANGFGGFTYYTETVAFYEANRREIKALAREMCRDIGAGCLAEFVAEFRGVDLTAVEVDAALDDGDGDDYVTVANALAWFAAEETSRALVES